MGTPRLRMAMNALSDLPLFTAAQRARVLRLARVTAGPDSEFEQGFRVTGDRRLRVGRDCYIGFNACIDCAAEVVIGNGSSVAQGGVPNPFRNA